MSAARAATSPLPVVARATAPTLPAARVGMLVFLGAETMLFAGFVAAFMVFRFAAPVWPPPMQPRLPIGTTAVNTCLLLASGWTMRRAVETRRRGPARAERFLCLTLALGTAFIVFQGFEWVRLLGYGLTAPSGIYGGTFYAIVGAHAAHLAAALVAVAAALVRIPRSEVMEALALYWYFVVGLWPILYIVVYLS